MESSSGSLKNFISWTNKENNRKEFKFKVPEKVFHFTHRVRNKNEEKFFFFRKKKCKRKWMKKKIYKV